MRHWQPVYNTSERIWKCKQERGTWKGVHAPHMFYESHSRNHKKNHLTSETDSPLCLQLGNACTFSSQKKNIARPIQWKRKFHFILRTVRRGWRKTQLIHLSTCCFESFVIIPLCSFWCLLTFRWLILPHHCWILLLLTSWQWLPKLICEQQDNKPRDIYLDYFEKIWQ